jgi:hypothetical protein
MGLMLAAMAASIVLGMLLRKHDGLLRFMIVLLAVAVTTLYYVFAERLM